MEDRVKLLHKHRNGVSMELIRKCTTITEAPKLCRAIVSLYKQIGVKAP